MKEKPLDGAGSLCLAHRRQTSCLLDATEHPEGDRPQPPHLTIDVASLRGYAELSVVCDKLHAAWGAECSSSNDEMFTFKRGCARPRARDPTQPGGDVPPNDSYAWAPVHALAGAMSRQAGDTPPLPSPTPSTPLSVPWQAGDPPLLPPSAPLLSPLLPPPPLRLRAVLVRSPPPAWPAPCT